MTFELNGKRALITGASRGIGRATAILLALEGVQVVVAARTMSALESTVDYIESIGGATAYAVSMDTTDDASVEAGIAQVSSELGGVDILVNAAAEPGGLQQALAPDRITPAVILAEVNVKVLGYLRCIQGVVPGMIEQKWGRIINVGGISARQTGSLAGSVRNVGVTALTKNLADELGPQGIRVNAIHPGVTRTERSGEYIARRSRELGVPMGEVEAELAMSSSIGRLVDATEIAWIIAFLASPKTTAINGDTVACPTTRGPIHY